MNTAVENPFDSIESAHAFVILLAATIAEAKRDLLEKVELYMNRSRRVLNDLRTLRRLLFEERTSAGAIKLEETETINVSAA